MAKKKTRKELLKEEDAFLNAANRSVAWAKQNSTAVIAGVIAVVVLLTAIWGGAEFLRQRDLEASGELERAYALIDAEVIPEDSDTPADPSADPPTFPSDEAKRDAVIAQLQATIDEAGSSGVADMARFYLGDTLQKAEKYDDARAQFERLVRDLSRRDPLFFLAVERAAYLQERAGEPDAALQTLGKLAGSESFYGDYASYHQARIYLAKGDEATARKLLETLEKKEDSLVKDEAKEQLDRIGRSAAAQASADTAAP